MRRVYRFPQVLPVHEIEPGFDSLVSACIELPTPAGYIDNLFVTKRGDLVIAECKLWRNPEARREVVAQIVDYAHSLSSWTYSDLDSAIAKVLTVDDAPRATTLYGLVEDDSELSEPDFADAVSRNLRLGRVLLLIVGDGVREGVESLAGYLQKHAGFHFTLGIIEIPVYLLPQGGYVIQPRVLARTINIERGIVTIVDGQPVVKPSDQGSNDRGSGRRTSISQERILEVLTEIDPKLPEMLQSFLDRAADLGIYLTTATRTLVFRWRGPDDREFAIGGIDDNGDLITYNVGWQANNIGHVGLAHQYLNRLAPLVNGTIRKTPKPENWYVTIKDTTYPPARDMLA